MCEEIDRQVLRKYDIESKLGKGVRTPPHLLSISHPSRNATIWPSELCFCRLMA